MGARQFAISLGEDAFTLELLGEGKAIIAGKAVDYSARLLGATALHLIVDGQVYRIQCETDLQNLKTGEPMDLRVNGKLFALTVDDERSKLVRSLGRKIHSSSGPTTVRAPMPGLVSRIEVAKGDRVTPGQGLVILEAMKMENEIRASVHGEVKEVFAQSGRPVEKGEAILIIG